MGGKFGAGGTVTSVLDLRVESTTPAKAGPQLGDVAN
ncbi:hypothetical protein C8J46_10323 [Sphingomonas sp. PP-F2F-A104-K0414]|nr:hypothetical protein C8J46_10323 [Sphingomonas sp. PP-F2F-A104-K0414]